MKMRTYNVIMILIVIAFVNGGRELENLVPSFLTPIEDIPDEEAATVPVRGNSTVLYRHD